VQPLIFQRSEGSAGGAGGDDSDKPNAGADFVLMFAKYFPQASPGTISHDGVPHAPGSEKAGPGRRQIAIVEISNRERLSAQ
jgi:hypothetical protein